MQKKSSPSPAAPRHESFAPVAWGENVGDFPLSKKNTEMLKRLHGGQVAEICLVWNPENLLNILEVSNNKKEETCSSVDFQVAVAGFF